LAKIVQKVKLLEQNEAILAHFGAKKMTQSCYQGKTKCPTYYICPIFSHTLPKFFSTNRKIIKNIFSANFKAVVSLFRR